MNFKSKVTALSLSLLTATLMPLSVLAEQFKAEEGTPIRLKLVDSISSTKNKVGDTINFQVAEDVLAEDGVTVLIKADTPAWGTVSEAEKRGMIGKKGEFSITLEGTKAVDGKKVPLRAHVSREGQSRLGTSIVLAALVPGGLLWLLMKGKDATLPAGTQISAYIDRDVNISTTAKQPQTTGTANAQPVGLLTTTTSAATQETPAVPDYLQKYTDTDKAAADTMKALEQLKQQGLLTTEEYEAKKKSLTKK